MNKLLNYVTTLGKAFYGLVIYFALSFIFNFILKNIQEINITTYNLLLIFYEIITLLLLLFIFRKKIKKDFFDFDKNYKKHLSLGFKSWLIGIGVMLLSNSIICKFITDGIAYNQSANMLIISKLPLYSVISMIICGPFIEEVVFRLSFKEALTNKKIYYILSILIFTSLHVLNGISSPSELLYFIPYGSLAFAFTYILDKTDNIFSTVIIHTVHNALTIVLISMAGMI